MSQLPKSFVSACFANELHDTHVKSFLEFKAINRGRDVVIVGTGPTLNYYKNALEAVHIGTNHSFLCERFHLDYFFTQDYYCNIDLNLLSEYKCVKFFGQYLNDGRPHQYPDSVIERNNGRKYFVGASCNSWLSTNIEYHPLMDHWSIIFAAINFALYTRPKRIYLVGCDCTKGHYYNDNDAEIKQQFLIDGYDIVKEHVEKLLPDIEIISINPIGLRNKFKDYYTIDFIKSHIPDKMCQIKPTDISDLYEIQPPSFSSIKEEEYKA